MADADKTLKLLIELGVVGKEDAAAAGKLLEDQKKSIQELAQEEIAASQKIIAAKNQEIAIVEELKNQRTQYVLLGKDSSVLDLTLKRLNSTMEEGGYGMNKNRLYAELFRRSMLSIGDYVPGLEYAVYGLGTSMGALTAGVIGGGVAIEWIVRQFSAMEKALNDAMEAASKPEFLANLSEQKNVLGEAAASAQGFADAESNVADNADTLSEKMKAQLSLYEALARARAGLLSAQKELALARVQSEEKTKQITPEQAAEAKLQIENHFLEKTQQDKEAAQNNELNLKGVNLAAAQAQKSRLDDAANAAHDKVTADETHDAAVKVDPAQMLQRIQKISQLIAKMEDIKGKVLSGKASSSEYGSFTSIRDNDLIEKAQAYLHQMNEQMRQYDATQSPAGKKALQKDKDVAAQANKNAEENKKLIADLTQQIETLKNTIAVTRPIDRATTQTREGTNVINSETAIATAQDKTAVATQKLTAAVVTGHQKIQEILLHHQEYLDELNAKLANLRLNHR